MPQAHEVITLSSDGQLREAMAVHATIHGDPEPVWTDFLFHHPRWSSPCAHRAILDGGRIVALTSVASWQHRFGTTVLPASEIGLVGTLPDHRGRGHSRALMESWLATMRSERIPLSFLVGIPDFYERWGYPTRRPTMPTTSSPSAARLSPAVLPAASRCVRSMQRETSPQFVT